MKAFPTSGKIEYAFDGKSWVEDRERGMDLRDYLAGQIAISANWHGAFAMEHEKQASDPATAKRCYQIADALMKAREL